MTENSHLGGHGSFSLPCPLALEQRHVSDDDEGLEEVRASSETAYLCPLHRLPSLRSSLASGRWPSEAIRYMHMQKMCVYTEKAEW